MKKQISHGSRSARSNPKKATNSNARSVATTKRGLDEAVKSNMDNTAVNDDSAASTSRRSH